MLKNALSLSLVALFVVGSVVPAEAGGFLKRCRLRRAAVHYCKPPTQVCVQSPADINLVLCDPGAIACCKLRYQQDLLLCPLWVKNDPVKYAKYVEIAKEAYDNCVMYGEKDYTTSIPPLPKCQCIHPEDPSFDTCTRFYDECKAAGGPNVHCCARCWLNCVRSLTLPPAPMAQGTMKGNG